MQKPNTIDDPTELATIIFKKWGGRGAGELVVVVDGVVDDRVVAVVVTGQQL